MGLNEASAIGLASMYFLMLGLGCTVELEKFKKNFQKPKGIGIGLCSQFMMMPLLAYSTGAVFEMKPIHRVALVLTGCSPGGAMSNILCFLSRADLDLSVAMTTASSIGSVFLMPLNIYLYVQLTGLADEVKMDYLSIALSAVVVVCGISSGLYLKIRAGRLSGNRVMDDGVDHETGGGGGAVVPVAKSAAASTSSDKDSLSLRVAAALGFIGGVTTVLSGVTRNAKSDTPAWEEVSGNDMALCMLHVSFAS
jgi:hypothetical protein